MICGICNAITSPVVNLLQCIKVFLFGRHLAELSAGLLAIVTSLFHTFSQSLHPKNSMGVYIHFQMGYIFSCISNCITTNDDCLQISFNVIQILQFK